MITKRALTVVASVAAALGPLSYPSSSGASASPGAPVRPAAPRSCTKSRVSSWP